MPHRMVGILSLLLVFALEMRAQGEVVLSIDGEPVKRSEFEYYFVNLLIGSRFLFYLLLSTIN